MCGPWGGGKARAGEDPRAPVGRIGPPRRPAAFPRSRWGGRGWARLCRGGAPPASRSRDRTAASAGHRGLRTTGSSRPGPAIQTPSSVRSPQKPATSAERAEPSSLLDRQDGPLSLIAADHLSLTFSDDTRMGRPLRLAARSGEPHAAHTADLHAGALGRAVGSTLSGHTRAILPYYGIEARASPCVRCFGL